MKLTHTLFALALMLATAATVPAQAQPQQPYQQPRRPYQSEPQGRYQYENAPWRSRETVAAAVHRLSQRTAQLANDMQGATGFSHLSDDAAQLAQSAEHFHEMVEQGTPYRHLVGDYRNLEQSYYHMRDMVMQAQRGRFIQRIDNDWLAVANAWENLAMTIGASGANVCPGRRGYQQQGPTYQPQQPYHRPRGQ